MKLLLGITLVLMLSAVALAVPDNQPLGPYTASFDINTNYQVQTAQPMETEIAEAYQMRIFTDNSTFAVIGITDYAEPTDATIQVHKNLMPMNMIIREGLNATNVEEMTIDGKEGFLVTGEPFQVDSSAPNAKVYRAMYWLDSEKCDCGPVSVGKTSVIITSTYPLDTTESLLASLHIEEGQATTSNDMPPASN